VIEAGGPLLDSRSTEEARSRELLRLTAEAVRAQGERGRALERYSQTAPSLFREIEGIAAEPSLRRLIDALEARPEDDPRNPRSEVFLPPAARRLVYADAAELGAVAEGRRAGEPTLGLRDAETPEQADAFRERYRQTADDLQALREWLQGLVLEGAHLGRIADALRASGTLVRGDVERVTALARYEGGSIRRAEQWAGTLQVYAHEVQTALSARERAFTRAAGVVEGEAATATLRETLVTEQVSSEGGLYVSLDVGVLYAPELEGASLTLGGNVYFAPVNKRAPLRANGIRQRLALTFGITVTNMRREEETLENSRRGRTCSSAWATGSRARCASGAVWSCSGRTTRIHSSTIPAWP
jgi:hypothetical protein